MKLTCASAAVYLYRAVDSDGDTIDFNCAGQHVLGRMGTRRVAVRRRVSQYAHPEGMASVKRATRTVLEDKSFNEPVRYFGVVLSRTDFSPGHLGCPISARRVEQTIPSLTSCEKIGKSGTDSPFRAGQLRIFKTVAGREKGVWPRFCDFF